MAEPTLRAPFPYFGGKSRCAPIVWKAFGDTPNFVEPFAGSLAVLLGRPHVPRIETVNDIDCNVSNFWRAVHAEPDAVATHCDWPVNEADLHARHRWLVFESKEFREKMKTDPDFYDCKRAGWWVHGICCWIGSGWCREPVNGLWRQRPHLANGRGNGVHQSGLERIVGHGEPRPNLRTAGQGVHKLPDGAETKRPATGRLSGVHSDAGTLDRKRPVVDGNGVHRKMPDCYPRGFGRGAVGMQQAPSRKVPDLQGQGRGMNAPTRRRLQNKGRGIHARGLPNLGSERGVHGADAPPCLEWFQRLSERLRRVRVCCGDYKRVLTDSVLGTTRSRNSGMNPCGVFLDPPYGFEERDPDLYASDDPDIAREVADWAREHGEDPDLRIALCGYEGEHEMPESWQCVPWKALRGYAGDENENAGRERVWFSPHCLKVDVSPAQRVLFADLA